MEQNSIYLIDLKKTQECLDKACEAIQKIVRDGEKVLFIGTKKQAKEILKFAAGKSNQYFMTERWPGGTLTNFNTLKKSIRHLKSLEKKEIDGTFEKLGKKEKLLIQKKKTKMTNVFEGIVDMNKLPGAVFVADMRKDFIAVLEARKLDIPVFAIVDTNCDPDFIDYPIPGNDDSYKSIRIIAENIADAISEVSAKEEEVEKPEVKMA